WLEVTYTRTVDGSTRKVVLDIHGDPVRLIDEAGTTTFISRNAEGQPLVATECYGTSSARSTTYQYNLNGDLTALIPPRGTLGTGGGRQTVTKTYTKDTTVKRWYGTTTLSPNDGTITDWEDTKGRLCQVRDYWGRDSKIEYNALGQETLRTYSDGKTSVSQYD